MAFFKNDDKKLEAVKKAVEKRENEKSFLLDENTPFNVVEAFRNLKVSISVSVPKKAGRGTSLTITSSYPEEGKTTVSVNLATMFAMSSSAKVVIVDADIRKGRVAKTFGGKSSQGLSEYLSGQATLDDVIRKSGANDNLDYISCGTRSPKPYELLESEMMKELDEKLRARYDYVIYDTPPLLLVSDGIAVASIADGTIIVCRHMRSYESDIVKSINTLKFSDINVLGVVVNDYKKTEKSVVGYNRYYNYEKYSYSYGANSLEDDVDGKNEE